MLNSKPSYIKSTVSKIEVRTKLHSKGEISQSSFTSHNHFLLSVRPRKIAALSFLNWLGSTTVPQSLGDKGSGVPIRFQLGTSHCKTPGSPRPSFLCPLSLCTQLPDPVNTRHLGDGQHGKMSGRKWRPHTHHAPICHLLITSHLSAPPTD